MKLSEAIDELQNQCCVPNSEFQKPKYQARALGIEALKRCKVLAENSPLWAAKPLPGETEGSEL